MGSVALDSRQTGQCSVMHDAVSGVRSVSDWNVSGSCARMRAAAMLVKK